MGREVRRVPTDWHHPQEWRGGSYQFKPLLEGPFEQRAAEWDLAARKWDEGFSEDLGQWLPRADSTYTVEGTYEEYAGARPRIEDYMPAFAEGTATHYMMYETCTEGTPISPAFATPEQLARWLTDNKANAFGAETASYEAWLRVCNGGYAPSMVLDEHGLRSGVEL
jgi:hypothetical protein